MIADATWRADSKSTSPTMLPVDDVDADVDDDRAGLEHRPGDEARVAGRDDDDVGPPDVRRRGRGSASEQTVTVASSLTSRNAAGMPTTADRPMTTASLPAISMPDRRRISTAAWAVAGRKPSYPSRSRPALSGWMPSMSLAGIDGVDDRAQADGRRQRHLDDDAVDGRVGVELPDRVDDRCLGRLAFELDEARIDADLRAAAQDLLEIDGRRRVAPDDHDGEAGRPTLARA